MRAIIQRVSEAKVTVNGEITGAIKTGFLVLLGIEHNDTEADADWLVKKIVNMRIFKDAEDKMNLNLLTAKGKLLVVSQFTLHALTKKGNRPSFITAAKPNVAIPLYQYFLNVCETLTNEKPQTGIFGATMEVSLCNNGPVTIFIDSKNKA